jgi:hypothetical protein
MLINSIIWLANKCRLNVQTLGQRQNVLPTQFYINRSMLNRFIGNKTQTKVQLHLWPTIFVLVRHSQHHPRMTPIWREVQNPTYFMTSFDARSRHWKSGQRIRDLVLFWRPWPNYCSMVGGKKIGDAPFELLKGVTYSLTDSPWEWDTLCYKWWGVQYFLIEKMI